MQEMSKRVALYQQKDDDDEQEKGHATLEEQARIYTVEEPSLPSTSQEAEEEADLSTLVSPQLQASSNVERLHNMPLLQGTAQSSNQAKAMKILAE